MSDNSKKIIDEADALLEIGKIEKQLLSTHELLESHIETANAELKDVGDTSVETKQALDKLAEKAIELADRLDDMEQRQATRLDDHEVEKTAGEILFADEDVQQVCRKRAGTATVEVKAAIVNAPSLGLAQPLTAGTRLERVIKEPDRPLRIRDILPRGNTDSNVVWFPKEDTFTSAADVVRDTSASPIVAAENITKPESSLTFTSDSEDVVTIAHFIPVSVQALDDSSFLQSYVNSRLSYGLALKVEDQLLNGTGVTGYINGLWTDKTAWSGLPSPQGNIINNFDVIRDASRQAEVANHMPTTVILNPADWCDMELQKDTQNNYLIANPQALIDNRLWGMQVIRSNSMTATRFLVLDPMVAQVWERENASLAISFEDSTNFQKNMATLRAEERLALTIYTPSGNIGGTLPF
jgi:HK97 family phage major capsid protein